MAGTRKLEVTLDGLHVEFLRAIAAQAGTSVDAQISRMIEVNLAAAVKAVGEVTTTAAPIATATTKAYLRRPMTIPEIQEMSRLRQQGLSYQQIGDKLDRPISVVWKNLHGGGR